MNKWKIAFWCCLILLFAMNSFLLYSIFDQAVALTYQKEEYFHTENDLDAITIIINNTDMSKSEIKEELKNHNLLKNIDLNFDSDTIMLYKLSLIFENNQLEKITRD